MRDFWKNTSAGISNPEALYDGHLGGTSDAGDPNSWYPEMWDWIRQAFNVVTMMDVGCGIGLAQRFFENSGVLSFGIDGSEKVLKHHVLDRKCYCQHDLTLGAWKSVDPYDLVICSEVAEHISPDFTHHLISTLVNNTRKVLVFNAALPGAGGHHHVNCQATPYWIDLLSQAGLVYDPELTAQAKDLCPRGVYGRADFTDNYFQRSGLIFTQPTPLKGCALFEDK